MPRSSFLALFGTAVSLAAMSSAAAAPATRTGHEQQWCPGQGWDLTWGANWDAYHCHGAKNEGDTDLDGVAPSEWGATPEPGEDQAHGITPGREVPPDQEGASEIGGAQG